MNRKTTPWINALRLQRKGAMADTLRGLFWIWGVLGLFIVIGGLVQMSLQGSVGVGTSSYVTAIATSWIGGLVLFGLGSIITGQTVSDGAVPVFIAKAPPRARGFDGEFTGLPFRILQDRTVEAEINDEIFEFSDWKEFVDYTKT